MKNKITEPKISNSVCRVALKIQTADIKDDKDPIVSIAAIILVISVSWAKENNCLPVYYERL